MSVIPFPEKTPDPEPVRMFCQGCGEDRTIPSTAGDYGPCKCGSTIRVSGPLTGSFGTWPA